MDNYLFFGRFQPFHYGHKRIIQKFFEKYGFYPIIGIFKPKKKDFYNPFNEKEIREIIYSYFDKEKDKIDIIEIKNLYDCFKKVLNNNIVVGTKTKKRYLYKIFSKEIIEIPSEEDISSTKIKKLLIFNPFQLKNFVNYYTYKKLMEKKDFIYKYYYERGSLESLFDKIGKIHIYF